MRRLILFFASTVLFFAPALASAQVYKWVDEKGVVNYSSQPPIERKATLLDPNSVSVSSYTPDETLTRAATTTPSANERALAGRIASLERRLEAERYSRQMLADAQARAQEMHFEQCLRDRRLDCDYAGFDPHFAPYGPTIVVFRPNLRPRSIVPSRPVFAPKPPRPSFVPSRASRLVTSTM